MGECLFLLFLLFLLFFLLLLFLLALCRMKQAAGMGQANAPKQQHGSAKAVLSMRT